MAYLEVKNYKFRMKKKRNMIKIETMYTLVLLFDLYLKENLILSSIFVLSHFEKKNSFF